MPKIKWVLQKIHTMNKINDNLKQLLIYAIIGVIGACVTGYFLYQDRMAYWKQCARDAFPVALKQELEERSGISVYFAVSDSTFLSKDLEESKIVSLESKYGKREYVIPYFKHCHNIESNSRQRGLYSVILEEYPLNASELNEVWDSLLADIGFRGKISTRVSVTDLLEHETCTYSDNRYIKADSLISYYMGARCEVGVTGYIHCSWWDVYTVKDVILLSFLIGGCLLLFFFNKYIVRFYYRFFVKEIPVKAAKDIPAHIYRLDDNLFFDVYTRELYYADAKEILTPQMAILLQGFLDAKDYKLTIEEIEQQVWPGEVVITSRVHAAIKRLHACLAKVSNWTIENGYLAYQLKSPVSSKKSEK